MPAAQAAKEETPVFLLAAEVLAGLAENSRQGHRLPTAVLYPGIGQVNSSTASGLQACLYDSSRRSRCTGKERDAESGLDWFSGSVDQNNYDGTQLLGSAFASGRYFSSAQGRFTGPDIPLLDQDPSDPQSWNLYGYVRNNPLSNIDPTGRSCVTTTVDGKDSVGDNGDGQGCAAAQVAPTQNNQTPSDTNASDVAPQQENVNAQQGSFLDLLLASDVPLYVPNDTPLSNDAQKVLTATYHRTQHDLGCVGLGGGITGGSVAASAPIIPKPFSAGGTSATSLASRLFGGFNIGKSFPTPVGTPGTSSFAWRASANLGRIAGRYLPYIGTVAGAAATYVCLGN